MVATRQQVGDDTADLMASWLVLFQDYRDAGSGVDVCKRGDRGIVRVGSEVGSAATAALSPASVCSTSSASVCDGVGVAAAAACVAAS